MPVNDSVLFASLSPDESAAYAECVTAQAADREISDGCARTIASFYHDGGTSFSGSFATTGAVLTYPESLWSELFGHINYHSADQVTRMFMDMMGTYLIKSGMRGPVDNWSAVWANR